MSSSLHLALVALLDLPLDAEEHEVLRAAHRLLEQVEDQKGIIELYRECQKFISEAQRFGWWTKPKAQEEPKRETN